MSDNTSQAGWLGLDAYAFTAKPRATQTALIPAAADDGFGTGDLLALIDEIDNTEDDVTLFEVIPGILGDADTFALPVDGPVAPVAQAAPVALLEVAPATDGGLFMVTVDMIAATVEGMLF